MDNQKDLKARIVLAAVGDPVQLPTLLTLGGTVAHALECTLTVLCVTPDGQRPDWLVLPDVHSGPPIDVEVRAGQDTGQAILQAVRERQPELLLLGWSGSPGSRRYLLGSTLDPVTRYAPCDVAVVRADETRTIQRALVPAAGGPNATLALELAASLSPDVHVTALYVVRETAGALGVAAGYEQLSTLIEPLENRDRISTKVIRAAKTIEGILAEAANDYDIVLIGASNESYIDRQLFGNVPQTVAAQAPVPTLVVRRRASPVKSVLRQAQRWLWDVQGDLTMAERVEVYRTVRRGARPRDDFFVMIGLAAGIAALGLLMNSPAVVIGAMVIAPLMSAIFGISMGMVQGDARLLWQAANTMLQGVGLALIIGAAIGLLVPFTSPTAEILSRTRPTLLDLVLALVSGTAGAYAQCRRNALGALSGVAIAVALVPPLATTGIGVTLGNATIAGGALLLFVTNLSAITAASSAVFWFFGFRPDPGRRTRVFGWGIIAVLVLFTAVSIPLTLLTVSTVRSQSLRHTVQGALIAETGAMPGVTLNDWSIIDEKGELVRLQVELRTSHSLSSQDAEALQQRLALRLRRPVALVLSIVPITELIPLDPSTLTPTPVP